VRLRIRKGGGAIIKMAHGVLVRRKLLRLLTALALGVVYSASGVAVGHFGGMTGYAFAIFVLAPGIYIMRLFPAPGRSCGTDCLPIMTLLSALVYTAVFVLHSSDAAAAADRLSQGGARRATM
jgi:hypothetical protein